MTNFIALLRAVNVGGRAVSMAELRKLAEELGFADVRTYIQSGNLLFSGKAADYEAKLEVALEERFGIAVPVMVRSAEQWVGYIESNPFSDVAGTEPSRLMMLVSKAPPKPEAVPALQERARDGERLAAAGGLLWIHYPAGAGTSKLSPSLIDRHVGSPATARNWRTVLKIGEMLSA